MSQNEHAKFLDGLKRQEAPIASSKWSVGDKFRFRGPGTPWHGHEGVIARMEPRSGGSIRYIVMVDGREIMASEGSLVELPAFQMRRVSSTMVQTTPLEDGFSYLFSRAKQGKSFSPRSLNVGRLDYRTGSRGASQLLGVVAYEDGVWARDSKFAAAGMFLDDSVLAILNRLFPHGMSDWKKI